MYNRQSSIVNVNKKPFTLAEVLITLALIGVIAALTIPALVNKTNGVEIATKVKKYQSVFQNAIQMHMTDSGVIGDLSGGMFVGDYQPQQMLDALKKYFSIAKNCGTGQGCFPAGMYKYLNGGLYADYNSSNAYGKIILSDGVSIAFYDKPGDCSSMLSANNSGPLHNTYCGDVRFDANGAKPPNQHGRDIFVFRILKNGTVIPSGALDDIYGGCDPTSLDITGDADLAPGAGAGCTAKVIREVGINY